MGRHSFPDQPGSDPADAGGPIELTALAADDRLLDRLGAGRPMLTAVDSRAAADPAAHLLAQWRLELQPDLLPATPSVGQADWAIRRGRPTSARPMIAIVAAICVLLLTAAGIGSRTARPGDALWPLTQVLWADRADSVLAGVSAQAALDQARTALDGGDAPRAIVVLTAASHELARVNPQDGKDRLKADYDQLWGQATSSIARSVPTQVPIVPVPVPSVGPGPGTAASSVAAATSSTADGRKPTRPTPTRRPSSDALFVPTPGTSATQVPTATGVPVIPTNPPPTSPVEPTSPDSSSTPATTTGESTPSAPETTPTPSSTPATSTAPTTSSVESTEPSPATTQPAVPAGDTSKVGGNVGTADTAAAAAELQPAGADGS